MLPQRIIRRNFHFFGWRCSLSSWQNSYDFSRQLDPVRLQIDLGCHISPLRVLCAALLYATGILGALSYIAAPISVVLNTSHSAAGLVQRMIPTSGTRLCNVKLRYYLFIRLLAEVDRGCERRRIIKPFPLFIGTKTQKNHSWLEKPLYLTESWWHHAEAVWIKPFLRLGRSVKLQQPFWRSNWAERS